MQNNYYGLKSQDLFVQAVFLWLHNKLPNFTSLLHLFLLLLNLQLYKLQVKASSNGFSKDSESSPKSMSWSGKALMEVLRIFFKAHSLTHSLSVVSD